MTKIIKNQNYQIVESDKMIKTLKVMKLYNQNDGFNVFGNGKDWAISFSAKDLVNNGQGLEDKCEKLYNHTKAIYNEGYAFDINTTDRLLSEYIVQQYYYLGNTNQVIDETGNVKSVKLELDDLLPINTSGEGAYAEKVHKNVIALNPKYDKLAGITPMGTKSVAQGISNASVDKIEIQSYLMSHDLEYDFMEIEQASKLRNINLIDYKVQATLTAMKLQTRDLALGGSDAFADQINGLFNIEGQTDDTSTISSNPVGMSYADFESMLNKLLNVKLSEERATLNVGLDNFVIPLDIFNGLKSMTDQNVLGSGISAPNRLVRMQQVLGGKIYGLHFGNKTGTVAKGINPDYGNLYNYIMYANDKDVLEMHVPIQPTLTAWGTANNWKWNAKLFSQFTGIWNYRPVGYVKFTHA